MERFAAIFYAVEAEYLAVLLGERPEATRANAICMRVLLEPQPW
jgi:hypothetical protein